MFKIIPKHTLDINGYTYMKIGKTIVSYCNICKNQQVHNCVGSKIYGKEVLYRFECSMCKEKLKGDN